MDIARNINSNGKRVTIPLLHKALNKAQRECINDIFHMFVTPITGQDGSSQPLPPIEGGWGWFEGADVSRQSVRLDVTRML